jgi:hypothetical protein
MQFPHYLVCLGIYSVLLFVKEVCEDSCSKDIFCSTLITTTRITIQLHLTIAAYFLVSSSCRIVKSYKSSPTYNGCAELAWSAAGGTFIFDSYVLEHPGALTRWAREVKNTSGLKVEGSRGGAESANVDMDGEVDFDTVDESIDL